MGKNHEDLSLGALIELEREYVGIGMNPAVAAINVGVAFRLNRPKTA